jgi:hypothetical protein
MEAFWIAYFSIFNKISFVSRNPEKLKREDGI